MGTQNNPQAEATSALATIDVVLAAIPDESTTATGGTIPLTTAVTKLGDIVQAANVRRERTCITDRGERVALVIHPEDWENIVDLIAVTRNALARINGTAGEPITMEQLRKELYSDEAGAA